MNRFLKSQDYLMKCLGFVLLFGFISLGAIGGCNNNSSGGEGVALTENDFSADASIRVKPDRDHFVTILESPDGELPDNDTGESGTDIVLFEFDRTVTYTMCWEDDNSEAAHFMELFDSEVTEVLRVEANGECASAVLEPGVYEAVFSHDGLSDESFPIFGIPQVEESDGEMSFLERINEFITVLLSNFDIVDDSFAQTVQDNVNTLINTRVCQKCDLRGADLSGFNLTVTDLRGADFSPLINTTTAQETLTDLSNALLNGADLRCLQNSDGTKTCANFTGADLSLAKLTPVMAKFAIINTLADGSIFSSTNFDGADLSNSSFKGSKLTSATLINATCDVTDFSLADLTAARLTGAKLNTAILDGTIFDSAFWCDGTCSCGFNSTDECVGCSDISTCTGPGGS